MTAVVCPTCHSKLKAPSQLAGKRATCPRCRTAITVPAAAEYRAESKSYRALRPSTAEETAEMGVLESTTVDMPVARQAPSANGATLNPTRPKFRGWLRAALIATLAASATFALWMATPRSMNASQPGGTEHSRR